MRVSDIMSRDVKSIPARASISTAAQLMADSDTGFLPVIEEGEIVGVLTDRDIVARIVARGHNGTKIVRDAMTALVRTCGEDDDLGAAVQTMCSQQIRRMVVLDTDGKLAGVLSLTDVARRGESGTAGAMLHKVTKPGGAHNQPAFHVTTFGR